jgi:PmbA protein
MEPEELLSVAEGALKKIRLDEAECYVSWRLDTEAQLDNGIPSSSRREIAGIGIRGACGKRVGFASMSSLDHIDRVVEMCSEAGMPENRYFSQLPDPVKGKRFDVWDERIASYDDHMNDCIDMTESGKGRDIAYTISDVITSVRAYAVANTRGISVCERSTEISYYTLCKAKSGDDEKVAYDQVESRRFVHPPDSVSVAKGARDLLCGKALERKEQNVVFDPLTMGVEDLGLMSMLGYGISAANVQEHHSAFEGMIGNEVASGITIYDDPFLDNGIGSRGYDDEGVPAGKKPIIENGMLKNYIYDSYSANRDGIKASGNGLRKSLLGGRDNFAMLPEPKLMNCVIEPTCNRDMEGLIREMDHGILVRYQLMGVLHANNINGDFSVVAPSTFLIRNGEIAYPLKPVTIAGNFYGLLKNIEAVGDDAHIYGDGLIPSIAVKDVICR